MVHDAKIKRGSRKREVIPVIADKPGFRREARSDVVNIDSGYVQIWSDSQILPDNDPVATADVQAPAAGRFRQKSGSGL